MLLEEALVEEVETLVDEAPLDVVVDFLRVLADDNLLEVRLLVLDVEVLVAFDDDLTLVEVEDDLTLLKVETLVEVLVTMMDSVL